MKIEASSMWGNRKRKPVIWFSITPETVAEKALLHSLYSVKGKVQMYTFPSMHITFEPDGAK